MDRVLSPSQARRAARALARAHGLSDPARDVLADLVAGRPSPLPPEVVNAAGDELVAAGLAHAVPLAQLGGWLEARDAHVPDSPVTADLLLQVLAFRALGLPLDSVPPLVLVDPAEVRQLARAARAVGEVAP